MENCSHCGDECTNSSIKIEQHVFCCNGCKTVFELLNDSDLCNYYNSADAPGIKRDQNILTDKFNILDEDETKRSFVLFSNDDITKVKFVLPQIHCSSCIWLLEHLSKLNDQIIASQVNFQTKEILITYNKTLSLKEVAVLLASIGYEPRLEIDQQKSKKSKTLIIKIGVAGFCFGNIMLFAFPEYLGLEEASFSRFFGWLSFFLSLPVILYAGSDYLKNAYLGIKQKFINMDIPISLGILTLFFRSFYELVTDTGAGYFDSLSGLIFFLLLGKWFQEKTYESLSFERNYKSYFPLSVSVKKGKENISTKLEKLQIGDIVCIRNNEIIPADGVLQNGESELDYSFVTGESDLIHATKGTKLYAGGRHQGKEIEVLLTHRPDNSYLTQLWNKNTENDPAKSISKIADRVSHYFTIIILSITLLTFIYWFFADQNLIWNAVSAVLIVACPCALALTIPFTLGNSIRFLGRKGIFLKNAQVLENLSNVTNFVFDKTGTLTQAGSKNIKFTSKTMSIEDLSSIVKSVTKHSSHPLSQAIYHHLKSHDDIALTEYSEIPGVGVSALMGTTHIEIGKLKDKDASIINDNDGSTVAVYLNQELTGFFTLKSNIREGLDIVVDDLSNNYEIALISGDSDREDEIIGSVLKIKERIYNCSPQDKLDFILGLQNKSKKVAMIGDGLNDAGALMQSDVGIAVSDDINYFVPACDIIIAGQSLHDLNKLAKYAKLSMKIIWTGFILSFLYNIIGLSFAITGSLSPIIAAVLMPLSSITIVAFASISTHFTFKKIFS